MFGMRLKYSFFFFTLRCLLLSANPMFHLDQDHQRDVQLYEHLYKLFLVCSFPQDHLGLILQNVSMVQLFRALSMSVPEEEKKKNERIHFILVNNSSTQPLNEVYIFVC